MGRALLQQAGGGLLGAAQGPADLFLRFAPVRAGLELLPVVLQNLPDLGGAVPGNQLFPQLIQPGPLRHGGAFSPFHGAPSFLYCFILLFFK